MDYVCVHESMEMVKPMSQASVASAYVVHHILHIMKSARATWHAVMSQADQTLLRNICVTLTQSISLWSQTPTEAQPGLAYVWWRVILTPAALPGMSSTEGEDKPPVQDEVSDGGMPGTANYCQVLSRN